MMYRRPFSRDPTCLDFGDSEPAMFDPEQPTSLENDLFQKPFSQQGGRIKVKPGGKGMSG